MARSVGVVGQTDENRALSVSLSLSLEPTTLSSITYSPLFSSSGDGLLSGNVGGVGGGGASGNKDLGQGPLNIALDVYPMADHEVASQSGTNMH